MNDSHSTFEQNITFIREAIDEIVKPAENGSYSEDSQRLYRARKFGWIRELIEQVQHSKTPVNNRNKCEVVVFLTVDELKLVRSLKRFNRYEFFYWEKKTIKSLYAITQSKDTTVENVASKIITVLTENKAYAQEPKLLKELWEKLSKDCNQLSLVEAEASFKASAEKITVPSPPTTT